MTPDRPTAADPSLALLRVAFDRGLPYLCAALGIERHEFRYADLRRLPGRFTLACADLRRRQFADLGDRAWLLAGEEARDAFADLADRPIPALRADRTTPTTLADHIRPVPPGGSDRIHAASRALLALACAELLDHLRERPDADPGDAARTGPTASPDFVDFEHRYLDEVSATLDRLELFGVTLNRRKFNYPMSTAYISLTAHDVDQPAYLLPQPIEQALQGRQRALIRGDAGSGKTTLLQRLAVWAARAEFPDELAGWNGCVPFFLPLRHFPLRPPDPDEFLDSTGAALRPQLPHGWVSAVLLAGRALVLIDGIDELPVEVRPHYVRWLRRLTREYGRSRFIVTSRQPAVPADWLRDEHFLSLELRPMNLTDQRAFVTHWHNAMRETALRAGEPFPDHHENDLADKLTVRSDLRRLAANPLLAALVCALHHDRRMQLPEDRMKLYEAALEMLLVRRDERKGVRAVEGVRIAERKQEALLQRLAYGMLRDQLTEIDRDLAVRRIAEFMSRMSITDTAPAQVFRHLLIRTGLLREPSPGRVDFVHRTFQDYLAARQALEEHAHALLIRNAHLDTWREVFVMAVGHAREQERNRLLRGLLRRANWRRRDHYLLLLAAECLGNAPVLDPQLREVITSRTRTMLPPRTLDQAKRLAGLGEPVLDLLQGPEYLDDDARIATVATAASVGTEAAMQFIARFAPNAGESMQRYLLRIWHDFDPEIYGRLVLSRLRVTVPLTVYRAETARALRHARNVHTLRVEGMREMAALSEIPGLTRLSIAIRDTVPDLRPLRTTKTLTHLWLICDEPPRNLNEINRLPELTSVLLTIDPVDDVSPLRTVPVDLVPLRRHRARINLDDEGRYPVLGSTPYRVSGAHARSWDW
ncbi:NACHT domain-containing protein [Embleya hyalina]|uniref:ATP-binding protein n=1 Tax=Embleya hyalina TaxID=516124 RepID=A0A401YJD7_9ACTN|nr:NACHT domain-containing protein [Embleya hyalina]GCD94697.1 ATP-binding protein [Embleya hyalina]